MKKIWAYLRFHLSEDFHAKHYATVFIILTVAIAINYQYDLEDSYLDNLPVARRYFAFFGFYALLYYSVALSLYIHKKEKKLTTGSFWITSAFALALLALDSGAILLQPTVELFFPVKLYSWGYKVSNNLLSLITVLVPILIFYRNTSGNGNEWFGLRPTAFEARPYYVMLAIMIPALIAVSFSESFQHQYPMYKTSTAHLYLGVGEWFTAGIYEIAYALDFITVEYLFRGLMVIGLMRYMGRNAVLAMSVVYCALHFGKPMGEAISSIFGGYLLGVVAYETRSVWGGIIVHVGIAWSMELIAYLQKIL